MTRRLLRRVVVTKAPPQDPVRIGGTIRQPQKVHNVDPVYPAIAQAARVQGIVILEATLSPDGRISNARILRSIPLLDQAALEAVRQWQYTPTLLNGLPVPVIMTITVMFTLSSERMIKPALLAEMNITPMIDVLLVLLVVPRCRCRSAASTRSPGEAALTPITTA